MFEKYDRLLAGVRGEFDNYWHDVGVVEAIAMVEEFSDADWRALVDAIATRPLLWLHSCAQTLGEIGDVRRAHDVLSRLLDSSDPDIAWTARESIGALKQIHGSAIVDEQAAALHSKKRLTIFSLSWVYRGGAMPDGGNIKNPCWADVAACLSLCPGNSGTVGLDAETGEGESRSLQVRSDQGRHLVTLGMEVDGEWQVRSYINPAVPTSEELVWINGDLWTTRSVCADWTIVLGIFKEFFDKGDISHPDVG